MIKGALKYSVCRCSDKTSPCLRCENAIPVSNPEIWHQLSWTKNIEFGSVGWGANFQRSLREMPTDDGDYLLSLLKKQAEEEKTYDLSAKDLRALKSVHTVKTTRGEITVEIPEDSEEEIAADADNETQQQSDRQSHVIQALLAEIGSKMGFKIWLPRADRERVIKAARDDFAENLIDELPMNYNEGARLQ
ncbi:MAG: hypothetical protein GY807_02135 [Gammaproteobacteria bacterium]|nr:hypothetical protein [Gammaproteobacteria bacterium]